MNHRLVISNCTTLTLTFHRYNSGGPCVTFLAAVGFFFKERKWPIPISSLGFPDYKKCLVAFLEMRHLSFLGYNSRFLCKDREKLENVCSFYIWEQDKSSLGGSTPDRTTAHAQIPLGLATPSNSIIICTRLVRNLIKDIHYDNRLNMIKIRHFRAK